MSQKKTRCSICGATFDGQGALGEHERIAHTAGNTNESAAPSATSMVERTARAEPNDSLGTPRQSERRNRKFERSHWE